MRSLRLLAVCLGTAVLLSAAFPVRLHATWDKGFDFRASAGFVTDPTDCTYVLDTDSYPVTRNSVTFGWTVAPTGARDRGASDPRLAGINFGNANGTFRVDLPSTGVFAISIAFGDTSGQSGMNLTLTDNGSSEITLTNIDVDNTWADATGTIYTQVTWPIANTAVSKTFSSTTLLMNLGAAGSNSTIAHLFLSQTGGATPTCNHGLLQFGVGCGH